MAMYRGPSQATRCLFIIMISSCLMTIPTLKPRPAAAGTSPQIAAATVAATVLDDCRVDGGVGPAGWALNFGAYQMGSATAITFSTVLHCTKGTTVSSVTLDNGLHYDATSRNMSDGLSHLLPYKIYTSDCASRSTEWFGANTPSVLQNVTSASVRTAIGGSECGTIDVNVNVPAGSYSDSVTIAVNFV
jgi:spore coat protein U-like protein